MRKLQITLPPISTSPRSLTCQSTLSRSRVTSETDEFSIHSHTLVNLVTLSDLPIVMPHVPELDYMSYIAYVLSASISYLQMTCSSCEFSYSFEIYERSKGDTKELSVRVSLSAGAHSAVLDASLDAKHALQVQPRRALTGAL